MDFLDRLLAVDDAVDKHLSETGTFIKGDVNSTIVGPFEHDVYTDESSSAGTVSPVSTFSVATRYVPEDPRGGLVALRGEVFGVVDMDAPRDGRTVLMLKFVGIMAGSTIAQGGLPYVIPHLLGGTGQYLFEGETYTLPFALEGY